MPAGRYSAIDVIQRRRQEARERARAKEVHAERDRTAERRAKRVLRRLGIRVGQREPSDWDRVAEHAEQLTLNRRKRRQAMKDAGRSGRGPTSPVELAWRRTFRGVHTMRQTRAVALVNLPGPSPARVEKRARRRARNAASAEAWEAAHQRAVTPQ